MNLICLHLTRDRTLIHFTRFRYMVAQILGAYIACLLVYVQWGDFIHVRHCRLSLSPNRSRMLTGISSYSLHMLNALPH